ncbi:hypothetical protein ORI20_22260 [Mycobacterium sp. CVI_P3]|uniref:Uncharacterized protein n=1 Tax=Mycobacterium pinniadriaticum TaxID=2994102 RepID=A0ABT3SIS6_9MYCO|nr:hypothetical protein [Mycobacterium pinniadriaticum]MCX2932999.1 hypothetical protein [Mycobacterium pinniadriaticum]MCX2939422.1 hypothetical protein [Mycobacterium pinniadriaticum]
MVVIGCVRAAGEAVVARLLHDSPERREVIVNIVNRQAAADLLAISVQSVTDRLELHKLIGIKVGLKGH